MLRPRIRRLMGLDLPRKEIIAAELEDELLMHLEMRAEQLERQGLSPTVAMAQARARFGEIDEAKRDIHRHASRREQSMKRRIAIHSFGQDLRFALRTLGRQKLWTAVAVFTLALGIGANTAVFSVVNDLLLDPFRYPHRDRLALISRLNVNSGFEVTPTRKQLDAWKAAHSFESVEGVATSDYTMLAGTEPSTVRGALISPTFVSFAGARLLMGRAFLGEEAQKGAAPVAMLSEHLWRARFGGSREVLGATIDLDGRRRTIVGVLADGVRIPSYSGEPADVWLPLTPDDAFLSGPVVGRLASGATFAAAEQELEAISDGIAPAGRPGATKFDIRVRSPGSTGTTRQSVFMLGGAVCLLLLIACANVAHLLLARGAAREREMAIRAALGAGYGRIMRQLMTESLLLSAGGCIAGLGIGYAALELIVALRPPSMSELANAHIDGRVLMATIVLSIITAIAFGLVAGLQVRGSNRFGILRSSSAGSGDRRRNRARSLLVISESALSVVLLVGATLLIRTVMNLHRINPGFDANNVYAMPVSLPDARYADAANRQLYASRLLAGTRRIRGAQEATIAANVPTRAGALFGEWIAEGAAASAPASGNGITAMNTVSPDYFALMGMRLLGGRSFDATSEQRSDIIISQSLGRQLWGGANPVGRRMRVAGPAAPGAPEHWNTVVGVVADANLLGLRDDGKISAVYFPAGAAPDNSLTLIVRMRSGFTPDSALRRLTLQIDPTMPAPAVLRLMELLARTVAAQRFMMVLLTLFAGLAVFLSAVGLYGVITYMVSQSTREIGIRVALGAARRHVVRMVLQQGVILSALGLVIGLVASVLGSRLLRTSLYGVSTTDPVSYAVGSAVLLMLAIAACIAPTVRAVRIDPMVAMRGE